MKLANIATKFLSLYLLCCVAYPAVVSAAAAMPLGPGPQGLPMGPMPMGDSPMGSMMAPQATAPGQAPQGGMQMPGGMPSPTAAEIEDAFAKVEEIQRSDPALFKQLEDAGKEIIMEMAKQDPAQLEAFANSFGLKPEELLAEASKPTTPEPQVSSPSIEAEESFGEEEPEEEFTTPKRGPSAIQRPPVETAAPSTKKPIRIDEAQVRRAIAQIAEHVESLRTKMASSPAVYAELRSLELDLLSLALLIAIVDAPTHTARLASGEYTDLIKALEKLATVLVAEEQRIQAFRPSPTRYDLLGVSPQVTNKQLDKVFKGLKKRLSPAAVEKELKKKGLTGDDLKRQVKAARITFSEIEEAYDLIKDPTTRRDIVDRAIELEAKQQGINLETSKAAIGEIREALSDALYKDEVISKLEVYLEKYAPEELKLKTAQEKEEKKRIEEQKRRARQTPVRTPGESFEPTIQLPSGSGSNYGMYGAPTWSPDSYGSSRYQPSYPEYGGRQAPESRDREREREKPEKTEGAPSTPPKEQTLGEKESQKLDPRTPKALIGDIDKKFKEFSKAYDDATNQKLLKELVEKGPQNLGKLEEEKLTLSKKISEIDPRKKEKKQEATSEKSAENTNVEKKDDASKPKDVEKTDEASKQQTEERKDEEKKTSEGATGTSEQKKGESAIETKIDEEVAALTKQFDATDRVIQEEKRKLRTDMEKLRANLKLDPIHKDLDILSKKVGRLRAQKPSEAESLAWTKFKEEYEKSEVAQESAEALDVSKTSEKKTMSKPIPSIKEKVASLGTMLEKGKEIEFKTPELETLKEAVFGDLRKKISQLNLFIKRIDSWFSQIPTLPEKKTVPPATAEPPKK